MLHEPWFLEAEKQTEIRIHRLRILFHIASTILVILARCLIGPLVKPMFIWVMASFPFLAAADLMILFVPRKRGHLFGWVKYAVSVMDLFYVTVMVFTVRTMLGENYYRMHYQVPAFAIFHVLIILSGFRFRRRITILNGLAVITVVSLIALMDLKDGGGQDPVWTFSYATIILSLIMTLVITQFISQRALTLISEKEHTRQTFGRYVSPSVAQAALAGGIHLGGEKRQMAVLFCDIKDFTTLSEKMDPAELVSLLNRFFSAMTDPIDANGGIVDKMIGDAVMALFGAPLPLKNSSARAVDAALEMRTALQALNKALSQEGLPSLQAGIGIAAGNAVAGNIGTEQRMEYTAVGDTVNVASRIEGLCRSHQTDFLIEETVYRELDTQTQKQFKNRGEVAVKGKTQKVRIYGLSLV